MALSKNSISNLADLAGLDALPAPLWVFDPEQMKMLWANRAALNLWNVSAQKKLSQPPHCDDLLSRQARFLMCRPLPQLETETLRSLEVLRYVPSIISVYTLERTKILQNPKSLSCYGKTEVFGQHFVDPEVARAAIAQCKAGQSLGLITQVKTQRLGIRWHQLNICPIPDPIAGVQMFLVNEQDLTEAMQLEAAKLKLYRAERLLKGVADFSSFLWSAKNDPAALDEALGILGAAAAVQRIEILEKALDSMNPRARACWQGRDRAASQSPRPNTNPDSSLVVPIAIEGMAWGVLVLENRKQEAAITTDSDNGWSESERSILNVAASAIARFLAEIQPAKLESQGPVGHNAARVSPFKMPLNPYAYYDTLTGLPNRTFFMERLRQALAKSKRDENYTFAVLFLDLDRFKVINDSLGHLIGDRLLAAIARHLRQVLRDNDLVARLGGDEFAILLPHTRQLSDATHIADRIHSSLIAPFHIEGQDIFTSVSIGIALSAVGYQHPEELLRDADIVMYHAKDRGRSRSEVFNGAMHDRLVAQLRLEHELRQAIQGLEERPHLLKPTSNSFQLYYQPLVNLKTCQIVGFEALVRWNHPRLGLVPPEKFISIAEETGAIVPLGQWVLAEACQQLRVWRSQFPHYPNLTMSINLSGRQLSHNNLIAQIDRILEETGVEGSALKLEVTESVLMDNADLATEMLLQLKDRQIQLCMDDFGTGYSSLSYLHRFPLDTIKIDRSFINQMDVEAKNFAIVQTIVTLASNLGMNVIPEGVETLAQREKLQTLGCELGQGYLFSKPVDSHQASLLLEGSFPRARDFASQS
jgi:diguanylate cyclase (GGDEF)-like protein